ncbi:MAG TPA: protease complex subunit PrcB family protein, partial [Thermoanaerobaculia bacterium]
MTAGPVEHRTIKTGPYAQSKPSAPAAHHAQDAETYQRLWTSLIGSGEPPAIDFKSESAVFLLAGPKNTGGWSVTPKGATLEEKTLVVNATIDSPPPDAIVTQAFTSPFAVIAVKTKGFETLRWDR